MAIWSQLSPDVPWLCRGLHPNRCNLNNFTHGAKVLPCGLVAGKSLMYWMYWPL
jgi:hypothetical protein